MVAKRESAFNCLTGCADSSSKDVEDVLRAWNILKLKLVNLVLVFRYCKLKHHKTNAKCFYLEWIVIPVDERVCVGKWGYWANVRPSGPVWQVSKCTHHFYYRDGRYGRKKWGGKQGLRKSSMDIMHHLVYIFICNTHGIAQGRAGTSSSWYPEVIWRASLGGASYVSSTTPAVDWKADNDVQWVYMVQSLVGLRPSFHFCWILLEHVIHSTSIHTFIVKKCAGVIYMHSFCNCIHGYNMACLYILRFLLNAIYLESLAQVLLACFAGQGCVSTVGGGDQL